MQFSQITALALLVASATAKTKQKANEYQSGDCGGGLNFGHASFKLDDVTMDDSTHSVYLSTMSKKDTWRAFSGKTSNGGGCTGEDLGLVPKLECLNLDTTYGEGKRIKCVRYVNQAGCEDGIGPGCGGDKPPAAIPVSNPAQFKPPKMKRSAKFLDIDE
ncbi:hypothetical protein B0H66DRAFT_270310 [Apodospora peruviana]|uniref:Uncharacterized protein n=1 Tax=Apodospora peruviana TaxID=516989 RepID=A0AAE0HZG6_9PEZI|nr:hypothetical protein B0H66DRAFT_270310 [Apodospora peruviana]